jgi:hypothetical protein
LRTKGTGNIRGFTPQMGTVTPDLMSDDTDSDLGPNDVTETLRRAIGDRYLTYALSTIMHRALPDARDGLKPVHRRILYAMSRLRLSPTGGFLKSAKISGDRMVMPRSMMQWRVWPKILTCAIRL